MNIMYLLEYSYQTAEAETWPSYDIGAFNETRIHSISTHPSVVVIHAGTVTM
jgi:hypothetical protein